jgi:hypothetical protein
MNSQRESILSEYSAVRTTVHKLLQRGESLSHHPGNFKLDLQES